MAAQLLLLEDVEALGRSGEIVNVKPGYARNFLIPQGFAVVANKHALRLQERLKEERLRLAVSDRKESEEIATKIEGITLSKVVKVDHDGHMYGSVSQADILHLVQDYAKVELDKKSILLKHAIKETGVHTITVKLKEGVIASFRLKVMSEEGLAASHAEEAAAAAVPKE